MLTIFADNTMILDTVNDRQDAYVVATSSKMRGLERFAACLLRAVVPVFAVCAYPISTPRSAESCQTFNLGRHWLLNLSGDKQPSGTGQPVGPGRYNAG